MKEIHPTCGVVLTRHATVTHLSVSLLGVLAGMSVESLCSHVSYVFVVLLYVVCKGSGVPLCCSSKSQKNRFRIFSTNHPRHN